MLSESDVKRVITMEKYSVLMSVYYREKAEYLKASIESMLTQSVPPDDFVLVCDGPLPPELETVISKYERDYSGVFCIVRLEKNNGLGEALSKGIFYCKNELIARMDSDDISYKDRCEKQLEVFRSENVDIVGGAIAEFFDDISQARFVRRLPERQQHIVRFSKWRNPLNHPSVMFKKSAILSVGNYQTYPLFEDYHLWLRALIADKVLYNIQTPIVFMRVNGDLYDRRGGLGYYKYMLNFEKFKHSVGITNNIELTVNQLVRGAVCIVPIFIRQLVYQRLLRSKNKKIKRDPPKIDVTE